MSLKAFLERDMSVFDKLVRITFATDFRLLAEEEYQKTKSTKQSVVKKCEQFFQSVPSFGEWLKLSDKESWRDEILKIYLEQNQ